jgi:hypothetical protein
MAEPEPKNVKGFALTYAVDGESALAIYVPHKVLIKLEPKGDVVLNSRLPLIYDSFSGKDADREYEKMLKAIKNPQPKELEVPDILVEWGKKLSEEKDLPKKSSVPLKIA